MKQVVLTACVYCERSQGEIIASGAAENEEEALRFVLIGESQVLLCPGCRAKYAAHYDEELDELLNGPITFPPGVTAIEHTCPELEFQGKTEAEATNVLVMERKGDYYTATCEHCGVTVRSLAEDDEL
jgi:hypothetical protein